MRNVKKWIVPLLAVVLLAGCGGDTGGGSSRDELLQAAGVTDKAPATVAQPAPTVTPDLPPTEMPVQIIEAAQDVPTAAVIVVTATPEPAQIQGFSETCDGSTVVMTPDANEAAQGVVVKGGLRDCQIKQLQNRGVMP